MTDSSQVVISLKDAAFSYDGVRQVLNEISFEALRGERVFILGHNGSGKSTLVKILGALQPLSQGACFVCGHDISDAASLADIREKVSVVFQNPESQIVAAIVEDDAAFAPENQGLNPSEIEKRVSWALEKAGLLDKRAALSSALSGGEKQRLALAGALAADAVCLILDEPTAMLDPEGRAEVEKLLRALHASGMTIVQVSHTLEEVDDADRVLVLAAGRLVWQGGRDAFWMRAESLGFELPPLPALRRRLAEKGIAAPGGGSNVEDFLPVLSGLLEKKPKEVKSEEESDENPGETPFLRPPFFEVRELSYNCNISTPLETQALRDISCLFPKGSWTSILGRTGSGKTTLVQHLNGLNRVQTGDILIENEALPRSGPKLRELRRRVGLVFQSPETQFFSPTVREELEFAPLNWGFSKERTDAGVALAMESVGLGNEYLERNPLRLSGGERRLVAIASVLSFDPECLVFDEPLAGLDAHYRKRIIALLSRLREAGKTIVTVTHDLETAFDHSDRLLVLDMGMRMCEGSVRATLPALLKLRSSFMLPEILRISEALRQTHPGFPLIRDLGEFCECFGL